jgi:3-phosphoshikimate 1-carboxyvinyltransferase
VSLLGPPPALAALDVEVPGDFSSAAFFLVLGLLAPPGRELVLRGVGLNETRTGLLRVLERMGARLRREAVRDPGDGEPRGDLLVEGSPLVACQVGGDEVAGLIDEVPALAMAAARARGVTRITGARELRVKESDRIRAVVENLRALGIRAEELEDGMEIEGSDRPLVGRVDAFHDHRIAMAFGVLGATGGSRIEVNGPEAAAVSFPGFWEMLEMAAGSLQGRGSRGSVAAGTRPAPARAGGQPGGRARRPPVVTVDGPAGSGKSSTARAVARRLGFRHLDSGALYRALTYALLQAGVPENDWPTLSPLELDRFRIELKAAQGRFLVMLGRRVLEGELRTPEVTSRVSPLSALPAVRAWLLEAQRRAGREGGVVADGRDMGTVVFPDAEVKVFLTASLPERARRRFLEREGRLPSPPELEEETARIQERDSRDSGRAVAPLRKPEGALEVDTSDLSFEAQVEVLLRHIDTLTEQ